MSAVAESLDDIVRFGLGLKERKRLGFSLEEDV